MTDTEYQELVTFRLLGERWYEDVSYHEPYTKYLVKYQDGTCDHVTVHGLHTSGAAYYFEDHCADYKPIPKPGFTKP